MKLKFFPRKDLDVQICDYRFGKKFAFNSNTDSGINKYAWFELLNCFKYNLRPTYFTSKYKTGGSDSLTDESYKKLAGLGVFEFEQYFPTDRWVNPITGVDEVIPDFYSSTWTAAGASVFANAVAGQPKPTGTSENGFPILPNEYPNHGLEMFVASGGAYGYDGVNSVMGSSNLSEFTKLVNINQDWFIVTIGGRAFALCFRNGRDNDPEIYIPHFLSGRQSDRSFRDFCGTSKIDGAMLGTTPSTRDRVEIIHQTISSRFIDTYISTTPGAPEAAIAQIQNNIDTANGSRGAITDFSHRQTAGNNETIEALYKTIGEHLDNQNYRDEIWVAGWGELWAYFWFRELTDRAVGTIIGDKVHVTLEWSNLTTTSGLFSESLPLDLMNTPLSIQIDLTGTPLEGKQIKSNGGMILPKGNNVYILDFPFRTAVEGFKGLELSEGVGDYYETIAPVATVSVSGTTLTVISNVSTKAVLFSHDSTSDIYTGLSIPEFDNNYKTSREFTIEVGKQYYVGVKTNLNNLQLVTV